MLARRKRKTRPAPEEGEEETDLAQYEHGEAAGDTVKPDLQAGMREMVLYDLAQGTADGISWSTAVFPTLARLAGLADDSLFSRLQLAGGRHCWRISRHRQLSKGATA
jgi:hypothetical protein